MALQTEPSMTPTLPSNGLVTYTVSVPSSTATPSGGPSSPIAGEVCAHPDQCRVEHWDRFTTETVLSSALAT